jgi:hypothetical protein
MIGSHRQRDPAGANREQQALALAVGKGRFRELQGVLPGVGPFGGQAPGIGNINHVRYCAQDIALKAECIGSCIMPWYSALLASA